MISLYVHRLFSFQRLKKWYHCDSHLADEETEVQGD